MGFIKSAVKAGATSMAINIGKYVGASLLSSVVMPKLDMPNLLNGIDTKRIDVSKITLPGGVSNYISPIMAGAISKVDIPTSINGVSLPKLPEMPDLSSVTTQVDGAISSMGIDTKALGIRDVKDILKEPNLSALKSVTFDMSEYYAKAPDITTVLDDFDLGEAQKHMNYIEKYIPGFSLSSIL